MNQDHAPAAGQSGTELATTEPPDGGGSVIAPASQSHHLPTGRPDDLYRRYAVEELALHLARGGALLARCAAMADGAPDGQLGAINAAARLINANAQLAKALAQLAMVGRRSRAIVETIQRPDPGIAELNSHFAVLLESVEIRAAIECGSRGLLQAQPQEKKEEPEALAIGCSI